MDNDELKQQRFKKFNFNKSLKVNYQFDLTDFSTLNYYKTIVAGHHRNLAETDDGLQIKFNEATKSTLQFHLLSLILAIILLILVLTLTTKNSLFILPKNYIKGFDGLRGISILLVIITHLGWFENLDVFGFYAKRVKYLLSGTTGVNIFLR